MHEENDFPAPKWNGTHLLGLVFLLAVVMNSVQPLLHQTGLFSWVYGDETPSKTREQLWFTGVSLLFQIGVTLGWFNFLVEVPLAELGLTRQRLGRGVISGMLFAAIFAPGAYALQLLTLQLMTMLGVPEQTHPFTQLTQEKLLPIEWILLVVVAVVLGPFWEELLFRGAVQPWVMAKPRTGGASMFVAACLLTLLVRMEQIRSSRQEGGSALWVEAMPFLVLAAMLPIYVFLARKTPHIAGLFATAVLFAWIHSSVWPTPIPLLWLALGLGWLRWKTNSLVGSFVLHAVFNGVALGMLLLTV